MKDALNTPRAIALQLFHSVIREKQPLDDALRNHPRLSRLETRDRAFVRLLLATMLRRLGQIDALIDHCLDRPLKPKATELRDLLRLGVVQLIFLETPPHAAVDTTVSLAQGPSLAGQKGLVNAILRRLTREGRELVAAQDAARLNTPDWLWQSWCDAYGEATARAIAEMHLCEPPLDLTVKNHADDWCESLSAEKLPNGSLRLSGGSGDVSKLPGYDAGAWWVQDMAATLPAHLLGDIAGKTVLDLCAAPGGKTAQLATAGAEVTAVDISQARLARVEENFDRLKLKANTVAADVTKWQPPAPAQAILLDAPCSATGTLRRHPDIAQLKKPQDLAKLTSLQDRLLKATLDMAAPGALIVYATCSLQPEEGPERIAALLSSGAAVERVPITPAEVYDLADLITAEGDLRSLPCHLKERGGMDGFYACRLRRL